MLSYIRKILTDFLLGVVWPSMNWHTVTDVAGQQTFTVRGTWDQANDTPMAWIDGVPTAATWASSSTVTLATTAPQDAQVTILVMVGANSGYYPRAGGVPMLGDLDMGLLRIINLQASNQPHHAVRRDEVQSLASAAGDANYLRRDGTNKPTQSTDWDGKGLLNLGAGTADGSATRKDQQVLRDGSQAFTGNQSMGNKNLTNVATATADDHAVPLGQAKTLAQSAVSLVTASGAWVVPANVSHITVMGVGGGGGGGGGGRGYNGDGDDPGGGGGGGGGSGGASFATVLAVTAGQTVTIGIGAGGAGGAGGTSTVGAAGASGGSTTVTYAGVTVTAIGGAGGAGGAGGDPLGNVGGAGAASVYGSGAGGAGGSGAGATTGAAAAGAGGALATHAVYAAAGAGGAPGSAGDTDGRGGGGGGGGTPQHNGPGYASMGQIIAGSGGIGGCEDGVASPTAGGVGSLGAGGGGGGGSGADNGGDGAAGGAGGPGYVFISY